MEKRNRQMHFRLTASEMERVEAKWKNSVSKASAHI